MPLLGGIILSPQTMMGEFHFPAASVTSRGDSSGDRDVNHSSHTLSNQLSEELLETLTCPRTPRLSPVDLPLVDDDAQTSIDVRTGIGDDMGDDLLFQA
ncbi:hypothetical protein Ac2012v2_006781 [Leucoagaricus gongylophorus]